MLRGNKQRESRDDMQLLDKSQNINEMVVTWRWIARPSSHNMPSMILDTSGHSGLGSADAQQMESLTWSVVELQ